MILLSSLPSDCCCDKQYLWKVVFIPVFFFLPLYLWSSILVFRCLVFLLYGTGTSRWEKGSHGVLQKRPSAYSHSAAESGFFSLVRVLDYTVSYGGFPQFGSSKYFLWKFLVWSVVQIIHSWQRTMSVNTWPWSSAEVIHTCRHLTQHFRHW